MHGGTAAQRKQTTTGHASALIKASGEKTARRFNTFIQCINSLH